MAGRLVAGRLVAGRLGLGAPGLGARSLALACLGAWLLANSPALAQNVNEPAAAPAPAVPFDTPPSPSPAAPRHIAKAKSPPPPATKPIKARQPQPATTSPGAAPSPPASLPAAQHPPRVSAPGTAKPPPPFLPATPNPAPWSGMWGILALLSALTCTLGLHRWRTQFKALLAQWPHRANLARRHEQLMAALCALTKQARAHLQHHPAPALELPALTRSKPGPAPAEPAEPVLHWPGRPRQIAKAPPPARQDTALADQAAAHMAAPNPPPAAQPAFTAPPADIAGGLPEWLVRPPEPNKPARIPAPKAPLAPTSAVILKLTPVRFATGPSLASLRYRLTLANAGDSPLGPVSICGDMIAASATKANAIDGPFPPADAIALPDLHQLLILLPGETREISGELLLPLSEITPLHVGPARFFVPLVRLRVETSPIRAHPPARLPAGKTRPDIAPIIHCASFLLGELLDSNPNGLAPLRLDGPPQALYQIAQQPLAPES